MKNMLSDTQDGGSITIQPTTTSSTHITNENNHNTPLSAVETSGKCHKNTHIYLKGRLL